MILKLKIIYIQRFTDTFDFWGFYKMKVLELTSVEKKDGYIYYIHHYNAIAKVEILSSVVSIPISFTVEINPLGIRSVDLEPLPNLDYPILPITKMLKSFIDKMAAENALPQV